MKVVSSIIAKHIEAGLKDKAKGIWDRMREGVKNSWTGLVEEIKSAPDIWNILNKPIGEITREDREFLDTKIKVLTQGAIVALTSDHVALIKYLAQNVIASKVVANHLYSSEVTLPIITIKEGGTIFSTGSPVEFPFSRNPEKAVDMGSRFQQDLEPAGLYMIHDEKGYAHDSWDKGTARFNSPLVLSFGDSGYDGNSWKALLHSYYGVGGRELTQALLRDGYDSVVTGYNYGTREIIALDPSSQVMTGRDDVVSNIISKHIRAGLKVETT